MEDHLYTLLTKLVEAEFTQEKMLARLIEEKINGYGIELTKNQRKNLEKHFKKYSFDGLEKLMINFNRSQNSHIKKMGNTELILDFEQLDIDKIEEEIKNYSAEGTEKNIANFSEDLVQEWGKQSKRILRQNRTKRKSFVSFHNRIWGKSLELLEAFIDVSLDTGTSFNQKFRPAAIEDNKLAFEILVRLHARGCQVSSEILTLLRNGFADGAHARWRTLHEISVVAQFIADHGNEVAERYIDHSFITDYQDALSYREHSDELSYAPMPDDVFDSIKAERDKVISKYNVTYDVIKADYWWASEALNKDRPNFTHIEGSVSVKFMRPFVKLVHLNIHAGSKGAVLRLGSPPDNSNLLIAGASIYGIAEPAQNTSYSLALLIDSLLSTYPNLDNSVFIVSYRKFMNEVVWAFDQAAANQK